MKKFLLSLLTSFLAISSFAGTMAVCSAESPESTDETTSFKITSIDPAAGSKVAGIAKGSYVKLATNMDDKMMGFTYTYTDKTTGEQLYTTFASGNYNGETKLWEVKNFSNAVVDFVKGHEIEFKVEAKDEPRPSAITLGVDAITWIGDGSEEFVYSPVTFEGITPANGTELLSEDDNTFVLTFSDAVILDESKTKIIYGQMQALAFESITSSEDGKVWTLVANPSIIGQSTPTFMFNVYAKDANGLTLEGNASGAYKLEEQSYYKFRYDCVLGSPLMTVTPAAGEVTSLKDFQLAYSGGMNYSYALNVGDITVKNSKGETVATVAKTAVSLVGTTGAKFSLEEEITAPDKYTLNIPSRLFALGAEFEGVISRMQTVEYTIAGDELSIVSVTPADGTEMSNMPEKFTVTFSDDSSIFYGKWQVVNLGKDADAEDRVLTQGQLKKTDGVWGGKAYFVEALKMYAGSEYQLEVYPYATEDESNYETVQFGGAICKLIAATWKGTTPAYQYAAVELESLTPSSDETIVSGEITAVFTAPVETLTAGVNQGLFGDGDITCVTTPSADKMTWTIVIPESVINSATGGITVNVYAKDADGKVVKGNVGEDENSYFVWEYNCYNGCPVPTKITPADGSVVEKIDVVTVEYSANLAFSYSAESDITVFKGEQEICTIPMGNVKFSGAKTATVTLPEAINAPGTYQVVFPVKYFMVGEELASAVSKDFVVEYTIEGEEEEPVAEPLIVDFENGVMPENWTVSVPESPYKGGFSIVSYEAESSLKVDNVGENTIGGTYALCSLTGATNKVKGNSDNWFISPNIEVNENNVLSFRLAANCSYSATKEGEEKMKMDVVVIDGDAQAVVATVEPENYFTWKQYAIDLSAYQDKTVKVAFHDYGTAGSGAIGDMKYIDNIKMISEQPSDYAVAAVTTLHGQAEYTAPLTVNVANYGCAKQTFAVNYQIGDAEPVTEVVNEAIAAGKSLDYTFEAAPVFEVGATSVFKVWVTAMDDAIEANNALADQEISTAAKQALPYSVLNVLDDEDTDNDDLVEGEFATATGSSNAKWAYDAIKYDAWIYTHKKADAKYQGVGYLYTTKAFTLDEGKVTMKTTGTATADDMYYEVYIAKYGDKGMADYGTKVGESEILRNVVETETIDETTVELTIPESGDYIIGIRPMTLTAGAQMAIIGISLEADTEIPSSISSMNQNSVLSNETSLYNLMGQKVNATSKGIVISNGKKFLVK